MAALCLSMNTCAPEEEPDTHGFVCVDFFKGQTAPDNAFAGTTHVEIRLHYQQCLRDFYLNQHSEYRFDGVEGEKQAQEWASRLCSQGTTMPLDCEIEDPVASFTQTLVDSEANPAYHLTVRYKLRTPGEVVGKRALFGPLPLADALDPIASENEGEDIPLWNCADGGPDVTIVSLADVQGYDSAGQPIWQMEKFANYPSRSRSEEGSCIEATINSI